ncbi:unnamed protein product [Absidia cylindrospora]
MHLLYNLSTIGSYGHTLVVMVAYFPDRDIACGKQVALPSNNYYHQLDRIHIRGHVGVDLESTAVTY